MDVVFDYDDKTSTWSEAPEAYGTIECATKEDYEYAKKAIKGYKELEAKHWDECRQIAHYDDEIKRLKATDQTVKHGQWEYIRNVKLSGTIKLCECNQCHNKIFGSLSYCGNCGARMDGEVE